jgi:hypothetical protein
VEDELRRRRIGEYDRDDGNNDAEADGIDDESCKEYGKDFAVYVSTMYQIQPPMGTCSFLSIECADTPYG